MKNEGNIINETLVWKATLSSKQGGRFPVLLILDGEGENRFRKKFSLRTREGGIVWFG